MCGIAGYFGPRELPEERVEACLRLMRRRGPDAQGVCRASAPGGRRLCLLHTRLSIIDIDPRADQPFFRNGLRLIYNGELYNYPELRARLKSEGECFSTDSDTEVLCALLVRWGLDGLDACEGMWAFAAYDEREGRLVLCRDRFGEKPLYLCRDREGGLYFGSEVKFLFALRGKGFPVNTPHLLRYLINGYRALYKSGEQFFLGVEELPAATIMEIAPDGSQKKWSYWTPEVKVDKGMDFCEAVERVREALIRSVRLRLRSDAPLAFCMSGGVDSNSLISIAARVLHHDVHGFTIVNTDQRYDEQGMIERSVAELGIRHTAIPMQAREFLPRLRSLVRSHDAPVFTVSSFAHWLLMQAVALHGYKVCVSGVGADELLAGYYDHHLMYLAEVRNDSELFEKSLENWRKHIRPLVRNPLLRDPNAFVDNPRLRDHLYLNADEFQKRLKSGFHEPFAERRYHPGLLRNRMLNELFHEVVPVILHEDDLNAMYFSIENRSPFLDRGLFELCCSVPERHLIRDGYNKAVLREAVRGIAPDAIVDERRKVGFNAPVRSFLEVNDPGVRQWLLDGGPIYEHVRKEPVEDLLSREFLPNSESKFLFSFINAKIFLEEYDSKSGGGI